MLDQIFLETPTKSKVSLSQQVASIAGNLSYKQQHQDYLSDVFVSLQMVDARLTIVDSLTKKYSDVTMDQFMKMDLNKQVLCRVVLPHLEANAVCRYYKVMNRAQNGMDYVNAGFNVTLNQDGAVATARICYGGINPGFSRAFNTEKLLVGKQLYTNDTLQAALATLKSEVDPDWVLPGAQPEYRKQLALSLFYRFVLGTCPADKVSAVNQSGRQIIERGLSSGVQSYKTIKNKWPLTKPVVKYEGLQQTSGEAKYVADIPRQDGELWATFVVATKVHARVVGMNAAEALATKGVRNFITEKDIPGKNSYTHFAAGVTEDEPIFVPLGGIVLFYGQPVGMVLADSYQAAAEGAMKVGITYEYVNSDNKGVSGLFSVAQSLIRPLVGERGPFTFHIIIFSLMCVVVVHRKSNYPNATAATAASPTPPTQNGRHLRNRSLRTRGSVSLPPGDPLCSSHSRCEADNRSCVHRMARLYAKRHRQLPSSSSQRYRCTSPSSRRIARRQNYAIQSGRMRRSAGQPAHQPASSFQHVARDEHAFNRKTRRYHRRLHGQGDRRWPHPEADQ